MLIGSKSIMTTFVTSFINFNSDDEKNASWRIDRFLEIACTGINLCVYVDSSIEERVLKVTENFSNVKVMNPFSIDELFSFKTCSNLENLKLPYTNNVKKDTKEYMMMMNSKIEFVNDAMKLDLFKTKYFAWIDFNISHIFTSLNYRNILNEINKMNFDGRILAIPGCQDKIVNNSEDSIEMQYELQSICWRFCGGFFLGDKDSLTKFYELYIEYFPKFIEKYGTIVWEVNFWAWLESNTNWSPNWYLADHNDSMIEVPYTLSARSIKWCSKVKLYDYPLIENGLYVPSSASYVRHNGKHILNTRYVNYTIRDERFYCHHSDGIIITKNVQSDLDENLEPISYREVEDPKKERENMMMYNGIEDIRLYEKDDEIYFLATSMSHTKCGNNLIVSGVYNSLDSKMEECHTIASPINSCCEKNWTPIITKKNVEMVIYKWSPMEIFRVVRTNDIDYLDIETVYNIRNNVFRKFRGSSIFTKMGENLVGVLHFSEGENLKRKYFHALVLLDGTSLKPIQYSDNFYFSEEPCIEFCTGFAVIDMKYQFWISICDKSPMNISVSIDSIPLCNKVLLY